MVKTMKCGHVGCYLLIGGVMTVEEAFRIYSEPNTPSRKLFAEKIKDLSSEATTFHVDPSFRGGSSGRLERSRWVLDSSGRKHAIQIDGL